MQKIVMFDIHDTGDFHRNCLISPKLAKLSNVSVIFVICILLIFEKGCINLKSVVNSTGS